MRWVPGFVVLGRAELLDAVGDVRFSGSLDSPDPVLRGAKLVLGVSFTCAN
jgi:hypothetical protein